MLRDVMTRDPATVGSEATVAEAAARMVRGRFGSLLVTDGTEVVGIFTERDVLRAAGTDGDLLSTRVADWMTQDPTTATADLDVEDALEEMLASGFRHLPVTAGAHAGADIIGIVSLRGLLSSTRMAGGGPLPRSPDTAATTATTAPDTADTADEPSTTDLADLPDSAGRTPGSTPTQVTDRRERMFEATRWLQRASRPPEGDPEAWRRQLRETVDEVAEVLAAHIAGTEENGGFFHELVQESGGRLQAAVRRLGRDHERSTELVGRLRVAIDNGEDPATLTRLADELFAQLEAHRHRGADLLWQAYGVELGGEE